jgi:hypothetical protein
MTDHDRQKPSASAEELDRLADAEEAAFNASNHSYSMAIALGAMSHADVAEAIRREYPHYWERAFGRRGPQSDG